MRNLGFPAGSNAFASANLGSTAPVISEARKSNTKSNQSQVGGMSVASFVNLIRAGETSGQRPFSPDTFGRGLDLQS